MLRATSEVTQQTYVPLSTCISDYACNHFNLQNCIKQSLNQNIGKLKLVPHPAKIDTNFPQTTKKEVCR